MLTTAQLATFKAAILADTNMTVALAALDAATIAAYYNGAGSGTVWRPSISAAELNTAIVWSQFVALPVATQNGYFALIQGATVDATNANVRTGFGTIFTGQSLTNLTALAQRVQTKFEALFTVSQVCPLFGMQVSVTDVGAALKGSY